MVLSLAFLVKTPLAVLGVSLWAAASIRRRHLPTLTPLIALFAVYWAVALSTNLNIGHRHLTPVYPVLFVLAGVLLQGVVPSRVVRGGAVAVLLVLAIESFAVFPHYLSFFNAAAGGPANGYRELVDSSTDWGQDLPALRDWWRRRVATGESRPLYLGYFGTHEPRQQGFSDAQFIGPNRTREFWLKPGYYALSATVFQEVYGQFRGRWNQEKAALWDGMRHALGPIADPDPEKTWGALEQQRGRGTMLNIQKGYNQLRLSRLCAYLRQRRPDATAGYSILIFELSAEDLRAALEGPLEFGS